MTQTVLAQHRGFCVQHLEWAHPTMVNTGPNYRFEPDTIGRTDDFEMISITVSDSSPRQYVLMLVETDKLSRVTLIAVGTNQNRFTASAAPQRRYALPNPGANPLPSATFSNRGWEVQRKIWKGRGARETNKTCTIEKENKLNISIK